MRIRPRLKSRARITNGNFTGSIFGVAGEETRRFPFQIAQPVNQENAWLMAGSSAIQHFFRDTGLWGHCERIRS